MHPGAIPHRIFRGDDRHKSVKLKSKGTCSFRRRHHQPRGPSLFREKMWSLSKRLVLQVGQRLYRTGPWKFEQKKEISKGSASDSLVGEVQSATLASPAFGWCTTSSAGTRHKDGERGAIS
jgi:hypothetical protein